MAKLFVIITGLGILVEKESREEACTVLLRRVLPKAEEVEGQEIPPHEPTLTLKPTGAPILIGGREVEFLTGARGKPRINNQRLLLPVGPELRQVSQIRASVLEGGVLNEGSKAILAGGVIDPIHIDENYQLTKISRQIGVFLTKMLDPASNTRVPRNREEIANGLLYQLDLERQGGAPQVRIADEIFTLTAVSREEMGVLRDESDDENYVVWIVNVASEGFLDPNLEPDIDFHLLYDWLEEDVQTRFVPVTERKRMSGQGNPPGQCMYGQARG